MSLARFLRHKSVEQLQAEVGQRKDFRRVLGLWQLTAIGIGGIIGVGIFVLAGQQAALNAGPAVALSFIIAGFGSACAALCYAEFAGLIPVTGSAYTYGYAVLGEGAAWIIGWDLLLEYALVVAVVAIGWSGYVQVLLATAGVHLPEWAQKSMSADTMKYYWQHAMGSLGVSYANPVAAPTDGHRFNVIAAGISLLVAILLSVRTEWGARLNTLIVAIKVLGVALVIGVGAFFINTANWHPFIPERVFDDKGVGHFGWHGVLTGASVVFFAVFGYDTLTTAAEEARNPQRDLPRAVLLSLAVAMVLYIAVSLVLTGIVPYASLSGEASVSDAFNAIGLPWISNVIAVAAVIGVISVLFAFMLGAARIWFALARDGLLPAWFARVHPRFGTPARPTMILGIFTAIVAGLLPIGEVAELVNIGTLSAFILICASVLVLRVRKPGLERKFRTPAVWFVAPLGILFSLALIWGLPWITFERFAIWMAIGLIVYFTYGVRHSKLNGASQ
ncbi:basic amino acid/polyamine antiporter, APA family [Luteibacter sp. UNC138MFCol5.1]|uniref:amino acid permease n=1 Tax=Luteibacter sp. UNC138MFCol5.1 TaxID=1502774 RepID=UPI0008B79A5F|nr:amino acid permease [Luteibacter sp. UNC138MFCol5.1]SEO40666.1 basic amino acid/polyamine antiporter, APA family [Luteibacter sp. UNC138MFCol5.1]